MPHIPPLSGPQSETVAKGSYYKKVTGLGPSDYPDVAQAKFGFNSSRIVINFISGTGPVTFSFNGVSDDGVVGGTGNPTEIESFINTNQVWLKDGTSAVVDIRAEPFM